MISYVSDLLPGHRHNPRRCTSFEARSCQFSQESVQDGQGWTSPTSVYPIVFSAETQETVEDVKGGGGEHAYHTCRELWLRVEPTQLTALE